MSNFTPKDIPILFRSPVYLWLFYEAYKNDQIDTTCELTLSSYEYETGRPQDKIRWDLSLASQRRYFKEQDGIYKLTYEGQRLIPRWLRGEAFKARYWKEQE